MRFRVQSLEQYYGSAQVLRSVSLDIPSGTCLSVLGRNGAGKTTLLKCIAGVLRPSRGEILIDDVDISAWSPHKRSRAGLAYVPQGREIFSELTVGENIEAAARAHDTYHDGTVDEVVALFPILREMWRRSGGALSGGQQQQLAIARALVTKPQLLLLDEPTEGIQPNIVEAMRVVIEGLKTRISILLVEQYLDFAMSVSDNYVIMTRGTVVDSGNQAAMSREALSRHISI